MGNGSESVKSIKTDCSRLGWLPSSQVTAREATNCRRSSAWVLGVKLAGNKEGGWDDIGWLGPG